jgi:hypothetical protein
VEIIATATSTRHQRLLINGVPARSGAVYLAKLSSGDTTFEIAVTAPDGVTTRIYTLHVNRARS